MQFIKDIKSFDDIIKNFEYGINLERSAESFTNQNYKLDRIKNILNKLDNPQYSYKTIHITGSKGKGTTGKLIANALASTGLNVGLYSSPHLIDWRERWQLANRTITDTEYIQTAKELFNTLGNFDNYNVDDIPTAFEMFTAFCFLLFENLCCNWAVIEVGLGGKLDATNNLHPSCEIFTPIELEHTSILGDTIEKIAKDKSKIIKPNSIVISSYQPYNEALNIIKDEALKNNAPFYSLNEECQNITNQSNRDNEIATIKFKDETNYNLKLKLIGRHNTKNVATAILALKKLNLWQENMINAIQNTSLIGRFETISQNPPIVIDASHTENSFKNAVTTFCNIYGNSTTLIFSCAIDKNIQKLAEVSNNAFDTIIITSLESDYKKSDINKIYSAFFSTNSNKKIIKTQSNSEALNVAIKLNKPILITGSFYLIGNIKSKLMNQTIK